LGERPELPGRERRLPEEKRRGQIPNGRKSHLGIESRKPLSNFPLGGRTDVHMERGSIARGKVRTGEGEKEPCGKFLTQGKSPWGIGGGDQGERRPLAGRTPTSAKLPGSVIERLSNRGGILTPSQLRFKAPQGQGVQVLKREDSEP